MMTSIESKRALTADGKKTTAPRAVIRAVDYNPTQALSSPRWWEVRPLIVCVLVSLVIAVLAVTFVFTAKTVVFAITPASATIDIDGGLSLAVGSRHLMRSGNYQITVRAEGYHTLNRKLSVGQQQQQRVEWLLEKLPGKLAIHTQPEQGVELTIDSEPVSLSSGKELILTAGDHTLVFSAPRYLTKKVPVVIKGKNREQQLFVELEPAWAIISIRSQPSQATVILEGRKLGKTPLEHAVLQGEHQLQFSLEGYETVTKQLLVEAGEDQVLPQVSLPPAKAWIHLLTTPAAANVTLDKQYVGQTPLRLSIQPEKQHQLAIFKPGYQEIKRTIHASNSGSTSLQLTLTPQLGEVAVRTVPGDAELYIDGKYVGSGEQALRLPAFRQLFEVKKTGYQTRQQYLTPRPGFKQSLSIKLLTHEQARWANVKKRIVTSAGQQLLLFHPDTFQMGASRREAGRRSNETLHEVIMTRAFYLADKEVTNAQFRQFKAEHSSGHVQGHSLDGDLQPVVKVTWQQAAAYCNWLSKRESLTPFYSIDKTTVTANYQANGYRLPTEAEWAWAARARSNQSSLKFPWGEQLPPAKNSGNFADSNSVAITGRAIGRYSDGFVVSAPVGSFAANHRMLFDMGGNVAEWTNDYYGLTTIKQRRDPVGPNHGKYRVIRGSSWVHGTVTELRLSYRDYGDKARDDVGFRLARFVD